MRKVYLVCDGSPFHAFGIYSSFDKAETALHEWANKAKVQYAHILEIALDSSITTCLELKEVGSMIEEEWFSQRIFGNSAATLIR